MKRTRAKQRSRKMMPSGLPTGRFINVRKIRLNPDGTLHQVVILDKDMPARLRQQIKRKPPKRRR